MDDTGVASMKEEISKSTRYSIDPWWKNGETSTRETGWRWWVLAPARGLKRAPRSSAAQTTQVFFHMDNYIDKR